jgi:hypothetical protein
MTSPVNLPHTLAHVRNFIWKQNILAVIKIPFEYYEVALLKIRKKVWRTGRKPPIRVLRSPEIIWADHDPTIRIKLCEACK